MSILRICLLALACLVSQQALAQRMPVPIVNHENLLVEGRGGAPLTDAQVRQAIVAASTATARQWMISDLGSGRLLATYHVRTHTVSVEIRYSAERYSVVYRDSINMKFLLTRIF